MLSLQDPETQHEPKNKQWIWLAIDIATGQIAGFHVGGRKRKDAKKLWLSLPGVYRQCAVCYSDYWQAYEKVIPKKRHKAVGKKAVRQITLNGVIVL